MPDRYNLPEVEIVRSIDVTRFFGPALTYDIDEALARLMTLCSQRYDIHQHQQNPKQLSLLVHLFRTVFASGHDDRAPESALPFSFCDQFPSKSALLGLRSDTLKRIDYHRDEQVDDPEVEDDERADRIEEREAIVRVHERIHDRTPCIG